MLLAILLTLWYFDIFSAVECWIAMLVGTVIGIVISIKVKMIEMPQMVRACSTVSAGSVNAIRYPDAYRVIPAD